MPKTKKGKERPTPSSGHETTELSQQMQQDILNLLMNHETLKAILA